MAYYNEPIQDEEEYQLAVGGVYDEQKEEEVNVKLKAGVEPYATDALNKPCIERLVLLRQIKHIIHTIDRNVTGSSLLYNTLRGWENNRPDVEFWKGTYSNPKFGNFVKEHATYLAIKVENNKFIRIDQMKTSQIELARHKLWKEFLTRWPLETVEAMTLSEFHTASDPTKDNFVNWLEIRTETLGSIWGGSGFKFGIYNRNQKDAKENTSGRSYTDNYGWYTKYGKSPDKAFEKVKDIILHIIKAAQRGDTTTIESIDFSPAIKWKIAFLYQPQDALFMPCIYKLEMLKLCKGYQPQLKSFNLIYEEIMKYRQGEDIIAFSYGLIQNVKENISRGENIVSPLNQIFYGPPGTGKTFHTIDAALTILDPMFHTLVDREAKKARFDELVADKKIRFVTFHQSFSYEDFVEGLRPVKKNGSISYEVTTGIFKDMCNLARPRIVQSLGGSYDLSSKKVWKMSLGNSGGDDSIYEYCRDNNQILMGWGDDIDFSQCSTKEEIVEKLRDIGYGDKAASGGSIVNQFVNEMKIGDIVIIPKGNSEIRAIAEVVGDYKCVEKNLSGYHQSRQVDWLSQFNPYKQSTLLSKRKPFVLRTLHALDLNEEEKQNLQNLIAQPVEDSDKPTPHVLIIDEINRGNISGIFGELITLIEPSKRAGAKEALTVQLPYSSEPFSVPDNLYIIGTMNTADRSLTGLDIALRRRFSFTEMPPRPDLLEEKKIKGTNITLAEVLEGMNARIELLLDRDHCLGHAPFMHLEDGDVTIDQLAPIFAGVILPLLQEYFFDDWHKIQLVFNDHQKASANQLVKEKSASYLEGMEEYANRKLWMVNHAALQREDFYTGIVSVQKQVVAMPTEDLDE